MENHALKGFWSLQNARSRVNWSLLPVWLLVVVAWGLLFLAWATGYEHLLHEAQTSEPLALQLLVFLLVWLVMIAAMMLPTTLPLLRLFIRLSQNQANPRGTVFTFLAAYALIWIGFAIVAFAADRGIHYFIHHWHWLHDRPWLVAGSSLLLIGAFQFSSLKEQCMNVCRHPLSFITHHYQRGMKAAWQLGIRHGLYCLGCCWALMLVMFAVGVGHLTWMVVLTGVMVIEKTAQWGKAIVPSVGVLLIAWGVLVLLQPEWLPVALNGL